MDAGDYISAGGACVAAVSACVAWWQVRVGQRAAGSQVAVVQRQLEHERGLKDQAERPLFEMTGVETDVDHGRAPRITAEIQQCGGAPLSEVYFAAHLDDEPAAVITSTGDGPPCWLHTGPGTTKTVTVQAAERHYGKVEVRLDLNCREAHGGRTWKCRVVGYTRPPVILTRLDTLAIPERRTLAYMDAVPHASRIEFGLLSVIPVPAPPPTLPDDDDGGDIW
ncbi:hypothetical protein RB200_37805 [Streptomyces sp. PmtG]